ncbi:DUF5412 family protein [Priestia megaterium]|nr:MULTISPECIES: DUF5412 family protein [Priestia]MCR8928990.1 DUF5412 domain-containing protein [Priestia megaterium]MDC0702084.1 DUF5412 family protein [Priestia sp. AB]MED4211932.1 DUF5412 family protein [Priestia megaterium]NGY89398.1 DUF5412 domain-containing protein [Priestia megaterium]
MYRNYPQETATVKWINDETVEISDHTLNVKQDTFNANDRSN